MIDVSQGGHRIDTLRPSARTYLDSGEPTKQIAIRPLLHTGEDLYLVFDGSPRPGVGHDQGVRESARQPALALRHRPRARLRHRHLARPAPRGAAGAAHERGVRARSLMLIAVIVLLVLAVGVVALVAWPLVRERAVETSPPGRPPPGAAGTPRRGPAGAAGARARPPGGQAHGRGRRARAPDAARRGRGGAGRARGPRAPGLGGADDRADLAQALGQPLAVARVERDAADSGCTSCSRRSLRFLRVTWHCRIAVTSR